MSAGTSRFLVRAQSGDRVAENEQQILDWFRSELCHGGDFVYSEQNKQWTTVSEIPAMVTHFAAKPTASVERAIIYLHVPIPNPHEAGPLTLTAAKQSIARGELSGASWIFVDGDKEWRQVKTVKVLKESLPALPADVPSFGAPSPALPPSIPSAAPYVKPELATPAPFQMDVAKAVAERQEFMADDLPSGTSGLEVTNGSIPGLEPEKSQEITMAFSALGLSSLEPGSAPSIKLESSPHIAMPPPAAPPPTPPKIPRMTAAPVPAQALSQAALEIPQPSVPTQGESSYDGITAEIPTGPIWLVKINNSEAVNGPFKFLDLVKMIEEGKISKNDKVSKVGTNRYCKILQQYEFNVKYTVDTVVEAGVEKQKIFIRRRHPRVSYLANVQVIRHGETISGSCVNVSAGGILMEAQKADFTLGEVVELKILPGAITRTILCHALVIGKVPKIPPGFALKFEDLKKDDKEAIEFFVHEALKREQP